MKKRILIAALCACAPFAHGQLAIITNTSVSGLARAMYYDLGTGNVTTLWNSGANSSGFGIVADDANGKLWYATGARIGSANYGTPPLSPSATIGNFYSDTTTVAQTWELTMANGNLYTWNKGSTTFVRGIYQVSSQPVAGKWILTQAWSDSATTGNQYDFQGLTYRTQDNKFYGVNSLTDHTLGLYSIDVFGNQSVSFLAAMPAGHTHVDGLTIDSTGNTLYMTEQSPSDQKMYIFAYDLASGTYGNTYTFAYADAAQRGTGVTWAPNVFTPVPEPASLAGLALAGAWFLKRRNRTR